MALNNILLVDDDKAFNFLNRLKLTESETNCQVTEVLNGQQALDYLSNRLVWPEVILLDVNMPVLDGFEFLRELEKLEDRSKQTKIFMLTSSQNEEDKTEALSHQLVSGYFDKPLSDEHIEEILAALN